MQLIPASAVALLLLSATAVQAQESGGPAAGTTAAPATPSGPIVVEGSEPKEEKIVCRREAATGSIRARRVCRTESQIAQEQAQGERTLDRARSQRQIQNLSQNQSGG